MSEQLAFDQLARNRSHVDRDKRPGAPLAEIVQRARHQLLAGAALASDHDRQIGAHKASNRPIYLLHRGRAADQRQLLLGIGLGSRERCGLRRAQRPLDDVDQFAKVERFRQVFERAPLGRLDRSQQRRLRTHDNDAQIRAQPPDARNKIETILVGHHHIGDDQIALSVGDPPP